MRRLTAILLISAFLLANYAKQVSYLECRIANSLREMGKRCDCERLLEINTTVGNTEALPAAHSHLHLDDWDYSTVITQLNHSHYLNNTYFISDHNPLNDHFWVDIDHPPQFN